MKKQIIFITISLFLLICGVVFVNYIEPYKAEKLGICDRFPNLSFCQRQNIALPPRRRPLVRNIPDLIKKKAFCTGGGGQQSQSVAHGVVASLLKIKRDREGTDKKVSDLLDADYFSGSSGGNVFLSLIAYDQIYNSSIDEIINLTAESTANKFYDTYISTFNNIRDNSDGFNTSFESLELPFFMNLLVKLLNNTSPGVLNLGGTDGLGRAFLLNRHNKTYLKDTLPAYKDTNVVLSMSLIHTCSVNIGQTNEISYTYNLPTGDDTNCRDILPFNHGVLTSRYNVDGVVIDEYRAVTMNQLRFWDGWSSIGRSLPSNKMFDTSEWVRKYRNNFFINTESPYKVYRSKNVASAECCQNNSESNNCASTSLLLFASKPGTVSLSNETIYNDNTEYYAYNIEVEKQPTGEWEDEALSTIPDIAYKLVATVPTTINRLSYDTSEEILEDVIAISTSAPGVISDPCLLKSALYRGGFSDQELFAQRLLNTDLQIKGYLKTGDTSTPNRRLYTGVCKLIECDDINDIDRNLSNISKAKPLGVTDSGGTDNTGVIQSLRAFQANNNLQTLDIFHIGLYHSEIEYLFKPNTTYFTESGATRAFEPVTDALDSLMDVVNYVANFGILEETALLAGSIAASSIVASLSNLLSPIFGIAITTVFITTLSEIVWEALDLDTDYHETTDKYGKTFKSSLHFRAPSVFSTSNIPTKEYTTTVLDSNGELIPCKLAHYANLRTVENKFYGIKAGTTVNLTVSIINASGSLISFLGDGRNFEDNVRYSFECIQKASRDPIGLSILNNIL